MRTFIKAGVSLLTWKYLGLAALVISGMLIWFGLPSFSMLVGIVPVVLMVACLIPCLVPLVWLRRKRDR